MCICVPNGTCLVTNTSQTRRTGSVSFMLKAQGEHARHDLCGGQKRVGRTDALLALQDVDDATGGVARSGCAISPWMRSTNLKISVLAGTVDAATLVRLTGAVGDSRRAFGTGGPRFGAGRGQARLEVEPAKPAASDKS